MRNADGERLGARRISDVVSLAPRLAMGGDYEFFARAEWARVREVYGLEFRELRSMDPALMYQAAGNGTVDVIGAFSTDGRIKAYDLRVLADDRHAIPPYDAIILAGARLRRSRPQVLGALRELADTISADDMRRMNQEVDQEGKDPSAVARAFIEQRHKPKRGAIHR
jgi:osmoprotectant transport system permease protein